MSRRRAVSHLVCLALSLGACACSKSSEDGRERPSADAGGTSSGGTGSALDPAGGGAAGDSSTTTAGGASTGGAGGYDNASGAGGAEDTTFINPVAESEADTELLGRDSDENGVRDDLQAHLESLSDQQEEQLLLVSLAREETRMLQLGGDAGAMAPAVRAQALRSMSVHRCVVQAFGSDRARLAIIELESALLNNKPRWAAWLAADRKLQGSILANIACDQTLVTP